jgi:hypothetical protein
MISCRLRWCGLAAILAVVACHKAPAPDAAEKARISRAWARMEEAQARSDVAVAALAAKANAKADADRNAAIAVEKNDAAMHKIRKSN